ncbi:GbsR/MarR family transcriptional regulator [Parachitinimonas caeni]|uniref:HTH-type transcriptional regulator n=1 Tax=Parachitinimonas caeni TaxID=3031301 RepID=A0ABT7DVM7_9NEIS|nr:GbsR/MarR family transcriptional regulator [Parachitinimonas caeni]MDK2124106.1 GbsR/MarR family transcriptional regulator [Parachitinimonas caeni]
MQLSPTAQRFVLHWGEMGTRWGVNRTVAQIHALLFLADRPLNADEIVETLGVARSNVSVSLKELQGWGLVRVVHVMGDRRDHFQTFEDVWDIFRVVVEERKRREIDPTLTVLRDCTLEAESDPMLSDSARRKLQMSLDFMESMAEGYDELKRLPPATLMRLLHFGSKVQRWFGRKDEAPDNERK